MKKINRAKRKYGTEYSCDICNRANAHSVALIDGEQLAVCNTCRKAGRPLYSIQPGAISEVTDIVDDFGSRIRTQREKLGLSLSGVAAKIQERESYLRKIERGELLPSLRVAKKLEGLLHVKIVQT